MGLKVKRRKKATRFRGSHSHGRGFKKKARGSGHRGGFGMSGTGKRADHRKSYILAVFGPDYFGKRETKQSYGKIRMKIMNIQKLAEDISGYVKRGEAKENKGAYEIKLLGHRIVGDLKEKIKINIEASDATEGAIESVRKHGGEITLPAKKEVKVETKKIKVKKEKIIKKK